MKPSGYDSFFKQAKKNAKQNPTVADQAIASMQSKKSLSDYSEEELRKIFKVNSTTKKSLRKSKRPKSSYAPEFSMTGALVTFALIGLTAATFLFPDELTELISKFEIQAIGKASAADQEKTDVKNKPAVAENSSDSKQAESSPAVEENSSSTKDVSYFSKLNQRKKQLDLREKELEELEQELNKQKGEIEARIQYLEKVRRDIAGVLKDRVEVDQEKVAKLVEFYSNMKPAQAAEIISTINEDLAIGVLSQMKKKNAAAILNLIEAKKARKLSEKFAGYKE